MPTQKICLKWNSFQSNILTSFENLWEEEGFVDVTLASDGQCIRAHKVILSACSPFFKKIFESNPCQHPVIILQDVHFTEIESLLNFVYKGEVHIDEDNLPALLRAAETLQIRGLSGASEQLKQKNTVLKKSSSQLGNNNTTTADGAPPLKRIRHILKPPRSPGPPSAPATAPPRPPHLTTPPAEPSQTQPYEMTYATKQEFLDHEPTSPEQLEDYDESNDDSMDLMAKHMAMEAEQLNELSLVRRPVKFAAGATYATFAEFEAAYNNWAELGHHPMSVNKSRTIDLGSDSYPYHLIVYTCKHHGKPRKRGKNVRPKQHYNGNECPVSVYVKLMLRTKRYVVKRVISNHNHPVSAELRMQYPDRRIPRGKDMDSMVPLVHTNAKVKAIKTFAEENFGKLMKRHDVHNMRKRVMKSVTCEVPEEVLEVNEVSFPNEPCFTIEIETM